ncbi:MAG: hypothetical protein ACKVQS_01275 [Fimbriimonadaceae bacterium]
MLNSRTSLLLSVGVATLLLAGCKTDPLVAASLPAGQVNSKVRDLYVPEAQAGVALKSDDVHKDMDTVLDIANKRSWYSRRSDAFALLASERRFDQEQSLERIISESGGYSSEFELPDPPPDTEVPQSFPTPAWRLAGIVVSEGAVIALLDQGTKVETIVPGQLVDGTEWRCVSIDAEKAVFRRDPRRIPSEVIVPLQGSLPGALGGGNAPSQGGGGRQGGGRQGGGRPGDGGDLGGDSGGKL